MNINVYKSVIIGALLTLVVLILTTWFIGALDLISLKGYFLALFAGSMMGFLTWPPVVYENVKKEGHIKVLIGFNKKCNLPLTLVVVSHMFSSIIVLLKLLIFKYHIDRIKGGPGGVIFYMRKF